jgi:hypothetical protein
MMPRPKSEITAANVFVGCRLTPAQREMYKELGGAKWLRKTLAMELERKWKQPSLGQRLIDAIKLK